MARCVAFCASHPYVETELVCFRCGVPICSACARPMGMDDRPGCGACIQRRIDDVTLARQPHPMQVTGVVLTLVGLPIAGVAPFAVVVNALQWFRGAGHPWRWVSLAGLVVSLVELGIVGYFALFGW